MKYCLQCSEFRSEMSERCHKCDGVLSAVKNSEALQRPGITKVLKAFGWLFVAIGIIAGFYAWYATSDFLGDIGFIYGLAVGVSGVALGLIFLGLSKAIDMLYNILRVMY